MGRSPGRWSLGAAVAALVLWSGVARLDPGRTRPAGCTSGLNALPFGGSVAQAPDCMRLASGWYLGLDVVLILALMVAGLAGARWIRRVLSGGSATRPRGWRQALRDWCRASRLLCLGAGSVVVYAVADAAEDALLALAPASGALAVASSAKLVFLAAAVVLLSVALVRGPRRGAATTRHRIPAEAQELIGGLTDPARYRTPFGGTAPEAWVGQTRDGATSDPNTPDAFYDRSCDVTMRGGTTSGVIYPLAVCALAERYVFRGVGGASAGAIAASATAAAELGRFAPTPAGGAADGGAADEETEGSSVRPGFAGLAELIQWLIAERGPGDPATGMRGEPWRLARLFQPGGTPRPLFRVFLASMQDREKTGVGRARALTFALLGFRWWAVPFDVVGIALFAAGPAALALRYGPATGTADAGPPVAVVAAAVFLAFLASRPITLRHRISVAVVLAPTLLALVAALVAGRGGWVVLLFVVGAQLLTTALAAVFVLGPFAVALRRLTGPAFERNGLGMVPGVRGAPAGRLVGAFDRLAGLPRPGDQPALAEWLAGRIDDLAGIPPAGATRHCLTMGELWMGRLKAVAHYTDEAVAVAEAEEGRRVINLALMTTDIAEGRPYRLPFLSAGSTQNVDGQAWLFCATCLDAVLPKRVVAQLVGDAGCVTVPAGAERGSCCPRHPEEALHALPAPAKLPVILLARMSLSLPAVLAAVPLYRYHRVDPPVPYDGWGELADTPPGDPTPRWVLRTHWMSDGGISSNFPIHFFDNLLPLWPTFGLNLQPYPEPADADGRGEDLFFPEQQALGASASVRPITDASSFGGGIFNTFMSWRDTMQSGLPGYQGRIINVRQAASEGGTNFFMSRLTVARLAVRGYHAGCQIAERFCPIGGDAGEQLHLYRWVRLRIAARKYRQLSMDAHQRGPIYQRLLDEYRIPEALARWVDPGQVGDLDDRHCDMSTALRRLEALVAHEGPLEAKISAGKPPIVPNLRLVPPE